MSNVVNQEQQQPLYAAPPPTVQENAPLQPQPRTSRRWVWITLGVIGGLIVVGGIVLVVSMNFFKASTIKTIAGPTIVADQYYTTIKNQDYTKAYTFWDSNVQKVYPLEMFTSESQLVDKQLGAVTHYTIASQVQYPENNTAIVTLTVTRSGGVSQTVQLHVQQVGSEWKITSSEAHSV
jgi:hypothetical protein